MNNHIFYEQENLTGTDSAGLLQGQGDPAGQDKCAREDFYSNYFGDNFLGIYFKAFELFRIFFR